MSSATGTELSPPSNHAWRRPGGKAQLIFRIAQICAIAVLLGRGWQCIRWDIPIRTIMWSQSMLEGVVNFFGYEWREYAESMTTDMVLNRIVIGIGVFFWLSAFLALFMVCGKRRRFLNMPLMTSTVLLIGIAVLYFFERFKQWPELVEYASQYMSPLLLVLAANSRAINKGWFLQVLLWTVAATFVGHAIYALGLYPTPSTFPTMLMDIFGMEEKTTKIVLHTAGVLDIIVAILIFFPHRILPYARTASLWYAAAWGLATALARIWANIDFRFLDASLQQWLHETIMRIPNGAMPLLALAVIGYQKSFKAESSASATEVNEKKQTEDSRQAALLPA